MAETDTVDRRTLFASDLPLLQESEIQWNRLRENLRPCYNRYRKEILYGLESLAIAFDDGRLDLLDKVLYVSFSLWERGLARLDGSTRAKKAESASDREQIILALASFSLALKYEDHRYEPDMSMIVKYGTEAFPRPFGTCVRVDGGVPPTEKEIANLERELWTCLEFSLFPVYPTDFLTLFLATIKIDIDMADEDAWGADASEVLKSFRADATRVVIHACIRDEKFYAYSPSLLASGALYSTVMVPRWPSELELASGYHPVRVRRLALQMYPVAESYVKGTENEKFLPHFVEDLRRKRTSYETFRPKVRCGNAAPATPLPALYSTPKTKTRRSMSQSVISTQKQRQLFQPTIARFLKNDRRP